MAYRVDLRGDDETLDRLLALGALDVDVLADGRIAALLPDGVDMARATQALGGEVAVSPAYGRDADSVWVLRPQPVRFGPLSVMPAGPDVVPSDDTIVLIDSRVFGTGLHPTTAACLEALADLIPPAPPATVLDVGTGSGVLALAALRLGVPGATAIDIDANAVRVAAANAALNGLGDRLTLRHGGPEQVAGTWPLVLANILAAPLIEMAPVVGRLVGHAGRLILSGIPAGVEDDVLRAYRRLGMSCLDVRPRAGWTALVMQGAW